MGAEVGIGMMIAGGATEIIGNIKANSDQAKAERANAAFFREQAKFAQEAGERAERIFRDEFAQHMGFAKTAVAASGFAMEGSILSELADQELKADREIEAIRKETEFNARLAFLRGEASDRNADNLSGFWNNFLPAAGKGMSTAGSILTRKGT